MSFGSKGSQGAGPSGNVPDTLYSGVTSSPFGQPGDLSGSMSPGTQTPYGGLEQQPTNTFAPGAGPYGGLEQTPVSLPNLKSATQYNPNPYRQAVAQATSDPSNLSASLGGAALAQGNWNHGIGSEFGEVDNPKYGGYTEPNWNKGAWGDNIAGWDTKGVALPHVPRGTVVQVMSPSTGKSAYATVMDKGPGASTGAIIDLLAGTRADLGLERNFKGPIQYRIVGGPGTPMPAVAAQPSQVEPSQALTQAQPTQAPKKQQPPQQRPQRRPWKKMASKIAPSFASRPAELDFLRQSLGGLPYNQPAQPTQPQTDQTEAT